MYNSKPFNWDDTLHECSIFGRKEGKETVTMKTLVIGSQKRIEKYKPKNAVLEKMEICYAALGDSNEDILAKAADAEFMIVDAIAKVDRELINSMPKLKLIHSEGVAYNGVDIQAAKKRGVYVCNNKGVNAGAVAEQTILLMLALLRNVITGDEDVRAGRQMDTKQRMMVEGIRELSECKIGLIGFGDIAKATAKRLAAFECKVYYYSRHRAEQEIEEACQASYLPLEELLASCDMISIHTPVTPETTSMVNQSFLEKMQKDSYLINTARGEIVDQKAVCEALISGKLKGAAFDTLSPEPVTTDNPLLNLPKEAEKRVIFSPHIGGITEGTFYRAHQNIWQNIERVSKNELPVYIVNK